MKQVIQICLLLIITICNLQSQTPENKFIGSGASYNNISEVTQSPANVNFVYELELFPGQVFNGWYYYWSNSGTVSGNFQINPTVSWLNISPNNFTSTSCSDIVPIAYNFTAPQTPGTYTAVIQDLNGNWENTNVTLHVTENPTTALVRSYQVNQGQTISQFDTLYWNGFGPFGCQGNYIPGNSRLFNYTEHEPVQWFSINPPSITVPIFGEGVIESTVTGDTTGNDFVYIIEEVQYYHLCLFYRIELNVITDVENENTSTNNPAEFALEQNYPNPFNPSTKISWQSPVGSHQKLKVYDILGNEVATLVDEYLPAGTYETEFSADGLSSGMYLYKLQTGSFVETKKMILLK
jgi:hypothetical protein